VTFVPADEPAAFRCHPLGVMARQARELGLAHERVPIAQPGWEASYRAAFARLAAEGVTRVVTGDISPELWPWLPAATGAAGLTLETPLADVSDPLALLDYVAERDVVATVSGMRADVYRPGFLGQPAGRALLDAHGLIGAEGFHPCGEGGEYHTIVTRFGSLRFFDEDPAALRHVERDGIWSLAYPPTVMSDFH
jgi:diphthamide synthase (EF-2-diphthine--ammonia ligase)